MKIKKVIIKNFKIFDNKTIELNDFSVVVGDNGSGKSTLLEAIHLALTGYYRGKPITGNISQDLFCKKAVDNFIIGLKSGITTELPKISIEVFFEDYPLLNGNNNSTGSSEDGFTFEISFDDQYVDAYGVLVAEKRLSSIPFEFYKCEWITFSRKYYSNTKQIDFKSVFLNTSNDRTYDYSNRLIKNYINDANKVNINQKFRCVVDELKADPLFDSVNDLAKSNEEIMNKNISIGIANASQNSWENVITIYKDDIPYSNIGTGNQCIVNTFLSFENDQFKNKSVILIEEPENHLSGMNLNILLNYIKRKANNYQVLICTHSSFVLNKLGMNNLLLMSEKGITKFQDLPLETNKYFEKVSGFDTLRYILCKKAILVEGPSDELIIQRAYKDKYHKLPIDDGIEIINVGLSFSRFLDLSRQLIIDTVIITDNDGRINRVDEVMEKYKECNWIKVFSGKKVYTHEDMRVSKEKVPNVNTLEPELFRANSRETLNKILRKQFDKDEDLLHYMVTNKTDVAWEIFASKENINYPQYILEAIGNE